MSQRRLRGFPLLRKLSTTTQPTINKFQERPASVQNCCGMAAARHRPRPETRGAEMAHGPTVHGEGIGPGPKPKAQAKAAAKAMGHGPRAKAMAAKRNPHKPYT
eukprot:206760-Pyramimonas_sp.AAC.1